MANLINKFKKKQNTEEIVLTPEQQQAEWLKNAKYKAQCEHYYMKKGENKEAIKHACLMLNELRTSLLTPKNYYKLYMLIFDKLRDLLMHYRNCAKAGENMAQMYQEVQYTGEIVPRLYLLVTCGVAYIESKTVRAQNILKDMVELCKGVQHPTRGLFLRHHLSSLTKNLIPDIDSEYGGTITESISYILTNFRETVNLFSRLKDIKDKEPEKREEERLSLRTLMGTNLIRMSQLEGGTKQIYRDRILPALLDVLKKYKDVVAQQFCLECIIQVFPDEYHILTLEQLLAVIEKLEKDLNLQPVFTSLLDRLADFCQKFPDQVNKDSKLIEIFQKYIQPHSEKMKLEDMMTVKRSLLKLILEVCPQQNKYVSNLLSHLAEQLETNFDKEDKKMTELVTSLIYVPVSRYKDIVTILELKGLKQIYDMLKLKDRRFIAIELCKTAIKNGKKMRKMKHMEKFFAFLVPLLKDEKDEDSFDDETEVPKDFDDAQNLVGRVVHLFDHEDTDELFRIFAKIRKVFGKGGEKRICFTLPSLVFQYLKLANRIFPVQDEKEFKLQKVFQYVNEVLNVLANNHPKISLHLYLQAAQCADENHMEQYVYEFLTQGFLLYEESDSKQQIDLLRLIMNTLINLKNLGQENFDTLSTKTCQYSAKLLKKSDQSLSTVLCSHLFYPCANNPAMSNNGKSLECLEWSLKIVNTCMPDQQMPLLIEILNIYLVHFFNGNKAVTLSYIKGLIELISKDIGSYEPKKKQLKEGEEDPDTFVDFIPVKEFYEKTKKYIKLKKNNNPSIFSDV